MNHSSSAATAAAGPTQRRELVVRIAIALAQGALLWCLYESIERELWPADRLGLLAGLVTAAVLVPLAQYLIADLASAARQLRVLAGLGLVAFGLGWHHGAWTAGQPYDDPPSFPFALVVLVLHALPFVQSALSRGELRPRYEDLFHFAWRNVLLAALGLVFTGVFWLLLALWGQLFRMLGLDFFHDLFTSAPFAFPATTVAVGVGVQLAGSVERLQTALRQQLLTLLKWLAPLAILILVLFTVALLAKSPELFSQQRRAISAAWLLWLVAFTVALVNAAYQDGREEAPYPRWLGSAIRFALPLLVPVAVLAAIAIGIRIEAHGLTVPRVWALLVALVAVAYSLGYAWAALRKSSWMSGMGTVNVGIALGTIALLALALSPVLSPERLAAASQAKHALLEPEGDALRYLRFESGRYGRERLAALAKIQDHPEADRIRLAAQRMRDRKDPWNRDRSRSALAADSFEVFPAGAALDPELIKLVREAERLPYLAECEPDDRCPVLFADLNRDGSAEALVFGDHQAAAATRVDGRWTIVHVARGAAQPARYFDRRAVREALRSGDFRIRESDWQVAVIGGEAYVLGEPAAAPASGTNSD
jgi:Domain of unknown function (DUF4153)